MFSTPKFIALHFLPVSVKRFLSFECAWAASITLCFHAFLQYYALHLLSVAFQLHLSIQLKNNTKDSSDISPSFACRSKRSLFFALATFSVCPSCFYYVNVLEALAVCCLWTAEQRNFHAGNLSIHNETVSVCVCASVCDMASLSVSNSPGS